MSEGIDIKAGIKAILERIDAATASRPKEVKFIFKTLKSPILLILVQKPRSIGGGEQNKASGSNSRGLRGRTKTLW